MANAEKRILVGDIETDPFKEGRLEISPFCAGIFDGKKTQIWWGESCAQDMVKFIMRNCRDCLIYFHNGGNFDFHFLLEFLPVNDCEFLTMGKRIVQIKLPNNSELRDSFAIIPKKLAAYDKKEIDYAKFERPVRNKHRDEIVAYLKSDLKNLRRMVNGFMKRFPVKLTLASSVFQMMKKEFNYDPGRSNKEFDEKFRPFFFGGRVEFWKQGEVKGKFHIVDINSAYPWAMTKRHWFGFGCKAVGEIPKQNMEQCLFVVEGEADGCFAERAKSGGISFPKKKGRFWVTGWELRAALDLKLFKSWQILTCCVPDEIRDIRNFSETLYGNKLAAKIAGDKEEEFFNKIAVNAGYGKLALNPERFKDVKVTTLYDKPDRWKDKEDRKKNPDRADWENCWDDKDRELSFWQRSSYKEGIDKFVNVATAASITGCVRAFLLRCIYACGGAAYCDTDSLVVERIKNLDFSDKLGGWKLELTVDSSVRAGTRRAIKEDSGLWIGGKKLYAAYGIDPEGNWKWKLASKGVRLSPEKIIEIAKGKAVVSTQIAPTYSLFSPPKFVTREVKLRK